MWITSLLLKRYQTKGTLADLSRMFVFASIILHRNTDKIFLFAISLSQALSINYKQITDHF